MPGFDVELHGGSVVRIDAEGEDTAMRVARDQGAVPIGVKAKASTSTPKTTAKKSTAKKSTAKKSTVKKSAPKKK